MGLLVGLGNVVLEGVGVDAELLGDEVANACVGGGVEFDDGHDELISRAGTAPFEHGNTCAVGGADNGVRAGEPALDIGVHVDHDRRFDVMAAGNIDDDDVAEVGVVQVGNGVDGFTTDAVEECLAIWVVDQGVDGCLAEGVGAIERDDSAIANDDGGRCAVDTDRVDIAASIGRHGGVCVEVDVGNAAVAPHFVDSGRGLGLGELRRGSRPHFVEPRGEGLGVRHSSQGYRRTPRSSLVGPMVDLVVSHAADSG